MLGYIDDFTIKVLLGTHLMVLMVGLMYAGAMFFAYFLRSIFNLKKSKKND